MVFGFHLPGMNFLRRAIDFFPVKGKLSKQAKED